MSNGQISRQPLQTLQMPLQPRKQSVESKKRPFVEIIEQPGSRAVRFRYECEGRSTGTIPGASSTPRNKTYPSIQVRGYQGEAIVVVSCVTKDKPYRPHPHNLVGRDGKFGSGVCAQKIQSETMAITFPTLGIQCVKKKDIQNSLKLREQARVDPFRTGFRHGSDPTSNIDLNVVRLCFQVFIEGETKGKFDVALSPVVSDPIYDKKANADLAIVRLFHPECHLDGGPGMVLFCEKVANNDIEIRVYEEKDGYIVWEHFGKIQPSDVHKQTAIYFKPPEYHRMDITSPIKVNVQLHRPSDGALSEPWQFEYCPMNSGRKIIDRSHNLVVPERVEQQRVEKVPEQTRLPPLSGQGYIATPAAGDNVSPHHNHRTISSKCPRTAPSQTVGIVQPMTQTATNAAPRPYIPPAEETTRACAMPNQHWYPSQPSNAVTTTTVPIANVPNLQDRSIPTAGSVETTARAMKFFAHALVAPVPPENEGTVNGFGPVASRPQIMNTRVPTRPQMEDDQAFTARLLGDFAPRSQLMSCRFASRSQAQGGFASSPSSVSSSQLVRDIAPRPQTQGCFAPMAQITNSGVAPRPQMEGGSASEAQMMVNLATRPQTVDAFAPGVHQIMHSVPPRSYIPPPCSVVSQNYRNVVAHPFNAAAPNQQDNFQGWNTSDIGSATDVAQVQGKALHAAVSSVVAEDRTATGNVPTESKSASSDSQQMEDEIWKLSGTLSLMSFDGESEDERMKSDSLNNLVNSRLNEMLQERLASIEKDESEGRRKSAT